MANKNYVLLERVVVGESGASSITFNSIPQTGYTDLKVVLSARSSSTFTSIQLNPNGLATNLSEKALDTNGTAASSASSTSGYSGMPVASSYTANTFSNCEIYIPNYTSANNKSWSTDQTTENNATLSYMELSANLWSSTAAITSLTLKIGTGNFVQYSTFSLYGLAAVGTTPTKAPKASGGSIIQTDGTYWYHAFLASGTFTPAVGLSCDVLVVAGGGGGGGNGGGGGAGGYQTFTSQSVAASAQTITVGAGGIAGARTGNIQAGLGGNSQFASLTASVGGGSGNTSSTTWTYPNGGSGGGKQGSGTAGTGTSGQGNNGGYGADTAQYGCGGGGGASVAGGNGTTSAGGTGGNGSFTAISGGATTGLGQLSGGNYYFAGGGGGAVNSGTAGTGGLGGGGLGTNTTSGTPDAPRGTPNTGGGGAGGGGTGGTGTYKGGAGGSGIVIVRYLA